MAMVEDEVRIVDKTLPSHPERHDPVNHPAHYKSASGLEAIDVIEAFELGYHLGNVVKYLLRHDKKGLPLQDLQKARWYLDRYIEQFTKRK